MAWWLLGAAALVVASLTVRALDMRLCDVFPTGTHFMWHILNGTLLGVLLVAYVRHGGSGDGAARPQGS